MADVLAEVRGCWLGSARAGFLTAIRAALEDALQVPATGLAIRLVEHAPENFLIPADRGDRFTRIQVTMSAGCSPEAKSALCQSIVANLARLAIPAGDVSIVLAEVAPGNLAVRGGRPASDAGHEVRAVRG